MLAEKPSEHYQPGEWNRLKVRVEKDRLQCFVNDELVIESTDDGFHERAAWAWPSSATRRPSFGGLPSAKELPSEPARRRARWRKLAEQIEKLPPLAEANEKTVRRWPESKRTMPRRRCWRGPAELEARAAELKRLAADVRTAAVVAEFERLAGPEVEKIDLLRAALTIARLDEEDLDVEAYVKHVERMADEIKKQAAGGCRPKRRSWRR